MSQFFTQTSGGGGGGGGDVNGPGGPVSDQAIARWDGTTGTVIEGSNVFLNDAGSINFLASGAVQGITFGADANTNIREPTADNIVISNAGATTATFTSGNLLTLANPLAVSSGGTGRATLTDGAVLVGDGTNPVEMLSLTNGQLLIGSTGASPVPATITAGAGVTVTNGAGSITISAAGGLNGTTTTTNTTPSVIVASPALADGVYQIEARVAARNTTAGLGAGYNLVGAVRVAGGVATLIGFERTNFEQGAMGGAGGAQASLGVAGDTFTIIGTGIGTDSIVWVSDVQFTVA